jgi:hypothetical protein
VDEPTPKHMEIESALEAYATAFIRGYSEALDKNYRDVTSKIQEMGLGSAFFPLYRREPGKNVALAVLSTDYDFYLFFLGEQDTLVRVFTLAGEAEGLDREWTHNTPYDKRVERVKDHLEITEGPVLGAGCQRPGNQLSFS